MPFKDWLQHYKLDLILPLFYETQTSQGYGYLEEVPAYYGRLPHLFHNLLCLTGTFATVLLLSKGSSHEQVSSHPTVVS